MKKTIKEFSLTQIKHIKNLSLKRIIVLSTLLIFVLSIGFLSLLIDARETIAYSPVTIKTFSKLLESKGQNLESIFKDKYSEICERDKDLAYIYLRKKLKVKNLNFTLYKIKMGDNFWKVAKRYGINIDTIIGANPELKDLLARLNQKIIILSEKGVIHEVKDKDENLDLLSKLYNVKKEDILKANYIKNNKIKVGDVLFIPGAKPVYMKDSLARLYKKRSMFRSPLSGVYTSLFGMRKDPFTGKPEFHNGVDIRVKIGTWVGAAAPGKVIYAGWINGFGYSVKIKHKNGYTTLYAHLSKIYVKKGQYVKRGQLIAKTGNSGRSTGPHLHFSIFKNGKPKNPLDYLW